MIRTNTEETIECSVNRSTLHSWIAELFISE